MSGNKYIKPACLVLPAIIVFSLIYAFTQTEYFYPGRDVLSPNPGDELSEFGEVPALPNGFIQGSLSFPEEPFPEYMKVFAYNLETGLKYIVESQGKTTYLLEVPPGRYHVYAYIDIMPGYWAYYNDYVVNGMQPESERGCPVVVEVFPDQVTEGVDPMDWDHYIDDRFYERWG